MQLLARHDPSLLQSLQKHPCNATYLSPEIQNELLQIMGNIIRHQIQQEVNKVGFFTLLCDETRDISKKEQMTIVLRYVSEATVYERFLCFVYAKELNAESLTKYICDTLTSMSIPITNCISQGYDGASGSCTGVQTRIKELAPKAVYIHCCAHRLNLILVDSVKGIGFASEFFALVELIYVFLSASKTHSIFLDVQKEVSPHKQPMELKRLIETRWACKYDAIHSIMSTYTAILKTLEIVTTEDAARSVEACGILLQIETFQFILRLILFEKF